MPVTIYDKKYLMKVLGFKIENKELIRNINNLGLNVKRYDEKEVEVEFNADRPDVISAVGLARALKYFMRKSRDFSYNVGREEKDFVINVGSHVSKIRPFISSLVVRNLRLGEAELKDIINFTDKLSETYGRKRSKIAIGLHDLRNVKPPFSYEAYEDEKFVPLNMSREMRYSEVLRKDEKGQAYGHLLGGTKRRYVAFKDSIGTMALVPILNSERTKVTERTRDMIIDITGSSKYIIEKIADMLAANFIDMGCDVHRVCVKYKDRPYSLPRMETRCISIPLEQINQEIGVVVGFNNVILLANKMGYEAALLERKMLMTVPAYRLDVINDQDVIEDIAIAYGYDYIQPVAISTKNPGMLERKSKEMGNVSEAMVGLGFSEELGSYLTNADANFKYMRRNETEAIRISNPKTSIATMFRTWLTPSLLRDVSLSMHDSMPQRIFELDMVFDLKEGKPVEKYHLAAVVCDAQVNFNQIKAVFESLAKTLRLNCTMRRGSNPSYIDGRCAELLLDKKHIGFLGEIHPEVLSNFGIEEPVIAFEIDLCEMGLCKELSKL